MFTLVAFVMALAMAAVLFGFWGLLDRVASQSGVYLGLSPLFLYCAATLCAVTVISLVRLPASACFSVFLLFFEPFCVDRRCSSLE